MFENQALVFINLDAIKNNYRKIKERVKPSKIAAVLKANSYGIGAITVAQLLEKEGCDYFCVANFSEAMELVKKNIKTPILVLGFVPNGIIKKLIKNRVELTCYDLSLAKRIDEIAKKVKVKANIHIKIDTGMRRIGFLIDEKLRENLKTIFKLKNVVVKGIFSHFSVSDEESREFTDYQAKNMEKVISILKEENIDVPLVHIANDGAIMMYDYNFDMVRTGIGLYGEYPSLYVKENTDLKLESVVSLTALVSFVKNIKKGDSIGYGRTFTAKKDMQIATIPVGYADGYPLELSNKGYVLINNQRANVVGRICMDQCMVDVTGLDVKAGDVSLIYGTHANMKLDIDEVAKLANTNSYDLLCRINMRIPRVYKRNNKIVRIEDYLSKVRSYSEKL